MLQGTFYKKLGTSTCKLAGGFLGVRAAFTFCAQGGFVCNPDYEDMFRHVGAAEAKPVDQRKRDAQADKVYDAALCAAGGNAAAVPFSREEVRREHAKKAACAPTTFTDAMLAVVFHASKGLDGCPLLDFPYARPLGCVKEKEGKSLHCLPLRKSDKIAGNKMTLLIFALLGWAGYKIVDRHGALSCTGGRGVTPVLPCEEKATGEGGEARVNRLVRTFAGDTSGAAGGPLKCPNWPHPTRIAFYFLENVEKRDAVRNAYTYALMAFSGGIGPNGQVVDGLFAKAGVATPTW